MSLEIFWFCLIAVLWGGYFVLEGFDFGVGMLAAVVGRDDDERHTVIETIGPVWDGNEVWLVVAAGATFAAFPAWYATMFAGLYLLLLAILVCLIVRAVSFDWRGRGDGERWHRSWRWASTASSIGAPFFWGVGLAALLHGLPLNSDQTYGGDVGDVFSVYTVLVGAATVLLFAFHGATFLTLRLAGGLGERAAAFARRLALPTAVVVVGVLAWTVVVAIDRNDRSLLPVLVPAAVGAGGVVAAGLLVGARRPGWGFAATALTAGMIVATLFTGLYPRVIVSSPDFANSLTISDAATAHYALSVITVVAAVCTPVVLLYQGWAYHVFRARVGGAPSV
ncbi:Cytochrome bd-I ubiquinol oxidase subunit 2 [Baekduia alba]|uniref:cytochrome d ubiquinol oxidase subunit II n=1 Tax=Baekduia alba TaxID=2997333 RepID=UPI0023417EC5|nr:cytochrome d ubiquinol oxidase subunit II [Baekduia alba]WCB95184.1 Cytochrome bd-I ubiquinol oxidase subunit 2 [Baekduia alba]